MVITKGQLAELLGISRARISQFLREGLPTRSDGNLDRDEALKWIGN